MNYTKMEFILFCMMYENANGFSFKPNNAKEAETSCEYEATFRDEFNYKIPFKLHWSTDGRITWDVPEFNDDEKDDTEPFFHSLIAEVYSNFKNRD